MSAKPAKVIGIYGVSGSGKSYHIGRLHKSLPDDKFSIFEGSEVIASRVPDGMNGFQRLSDEQKARWREVAIETVQAECHAKGTAGVVTGHFMFWPRAAKEGLPVYTQRDLDIFTHIIYLDISPGTIVERSRKDVIRARESLSTNQVTQWQKAEKQQLRQLCQENGILFTLVQGEDTVTKVKNLILDFVNHDETIGLANAVAKVDSIFQKRKGHKATLVFDGDKTLCEADTAALFWKKVAVEQKHDKENDPLKALFSSQLGYSYSAFRQAALMYEEVASNHDFDKLCASVAKEVTLRNEFLGVLRTVSKQKDVGAIIVTSGIGRIWERLVAREALQDSVEVVKGERLEDGFVVCPAVKAAVIQRLKTHHNQRVWAFGDSRLDIPMLKCADEAVVVVGRAPQRSKSMDQALDTEIKSGRLKARQFLSPPRVPPRLNFTILPRLKIEDIEYLDIPRETKQIRRRLKFLDDTESKASKLLSTATRNASLSGPALRAAHNRVGQYLATHILTREIGLEANFIPHVQGGFTDGHRLKDEEQSIIIALMRGGEPLAFGINDVYPLAAFLHANTPSDIRAEHIHERRNVILVDSVINTGKTVLSFVEHILNIEPSSRIFIVAGVVQAEAMTEKSTIASIGDRGDLTLVALRVSDNKYTGTRETDTGNRLFNTTDLD